MVNCTVPVQQSSTKTSVRVCPGDIVGVGVCVGVFVTVGVTVGVFVWVGVTEGVVVGVLVGVLVGVTVGVFVWVGVGVGEGIKVTANEHAPRPHAGSVQSVATNCNDVTVPTKVLFPEPGLTKDGPYTISKQTPPPPTALKTSPTEIIPDGYNGLDTLLRVTILKGFLQHCNWIYAVAI